MVQKRQLPARSLLWIRGGFVGLKPFTKEPNWNNWAERFLVRSARSLPTFSRRWNISVNLLIFNQVLIEYRVINPILDQELITLKKLPLQFDSIDRQLFLSWPEYNSAIGPNHSRINYSEFVEHFVFSEGNIISIRGWMPPESRDCPTCSLNLLTIRSYETSFISPQSRVCCPRDLTSISSHTPFSFNLSVNSFYYLGSFPFGQTSRTLPSPVDGSLPEIPGTVGCDHTPRIPLTDGSLACDGTGREFAEIEAPAADMVRLTLVLILAPGPLIGDTGSGSSDIQSKPGNPNHLDVLQASRKRRDRRSMIGLARFGYRGSESVGPVSSTMVLLRGYSSRPSALFKASQKYSSKVGQEFCPELRLQFTSELSFRLSTEPPLQVRVDRRPIIATRWAVMVLPFVTLTPIVPALVFPILISLQHHNSDTFSTTTKLTKWQTHPYRHEKTHGPVCGKVDTQRQS
jgi:hypothetical protein